MPESRISDFTSYFIVWIDPEAGCVQAGIGLVGENGCHMHCSPTHSKGGGGG